MSKVEEILKQLVVGLGGADSSLCPHHFNLPDRKGCDGTDCAFCWSKAADKAIKKAREDDKKAGTVE